MNAIEARFQPLRGLPCWNAKSGYGSFLTLEFGEPYLDIREPREASSTASKRVQRALARRLVVVHGEWHLWIYCCQWNVYTGKKLVGHSALDSSSKRPIGRAARELDGQKLMHVEVDPSRGASVFSFDLGSRLETQPYDADSEQWMFYQPDGMVLSYRADGAYSHQPGDTPRSEQKLWVATGDRPTSQGPSATAANEAPLLG